MKPKPATQNKTSDIKHLSVQVKVTLELSQSSQLFLQNNKIITRSCTSQHKTQFNLLNYLPTHLNLPLSLIIT
jgi:hypothetical protein